MKNATSFKQMWLPLLMVMAALFVHYGVEITLGKLFTFHHFERVKGNEWILDTKSLNSGKYFISAGRPRSSCQLFSNDELIGRNSGFNEETRDTLMLGASIDVKEIEIATITLRCKQTPGLQQYLTHSPVIAKRGPGIILHSWRGFTQLLLGVLVAGTLFLILCVELWIAKATSARRRGNAEGMSKDQWRALFAFSLIALPYTFSLSHLTRLFLSGFEFTFLHVLLRSALSYLFFHICWTYGAKIRPLKNVHIAQLTCVLLVGLFSKTHLATFYSISGVFFSLSALLSGLKLVQNMETRSQRILSNLAIAYSVLTILDFCATYIWETENLAPSILAILCLNFLYIRSIEKFILEKAASASIIINEALAGTASIQELLEKVSKTIADEANFPRASAYVDSMIMGTTDRELESFIRIAEHGYKKDTTKDMFILFNEGRGVKMLEALRQSKPLLGKGNDGAFFAVIPVGKSACINISDHSLERTRDIETRGEIIRLILPALSRLEERLNDYSIKQCIGLERLRLRYGGQKIEKEMGCIFLDIESYTQYTEEYGDAYSSFISEQYLPTLIRNVSRFAVPEYMRGDELYLVTISDFSTAGERLEELYGGALKRIHQFILNDGSELCSNYGFPEVKIRLGSAFGITTLICDGVKVRTSGNTVNDAHRLMTSSSSAGWLVRAQDSDPNQLTEIVFSATTVIVKKRSILKARRIVSVNNSNKIAA